MFNRKKKEPQSLNLADDIINIIYRYLDNDDQEKFKKHYFFAESCQPLHILQDVAFGKQKEVDKTLKKLQENNKSALIKLLVTKSEVTDPSGKKFLPLTPFQYAVWALDRYMWEMLLQYLPKDCAAHQLQALEEKGVEYTVSYDNKKTHIKSEKNFNHVPLMTALQNINTNVSYKRIENSWCRLGLEQKKVPMHVVNEYCNKRYSFENRTFKEKKLSRKSHVGTSYAWRVWGNMYWYACDLGIIRHRLNRAKCTVGWESGGEMGPLILDPNCDRNAIKKLFEVRMKEKEELFHQLLPKMQNDRQAVKM